MTLVRAVLPVEGAPEGGSEWPVPGSGQGPAGGAESGERVLL